jgi:hypothetical protein
MDREVQRKGPLNRIAHEGRSSESSRYFSPTTGSARFAEGGFLEKKNQPGIQKQDLMHGMVDAFPFFQRLPQERTKLKVNRITGAGKGGCFRGKGRSERPFPAEGR